jgi:hypothetical protein
MPDAPDLNNNQAYDIWVDTLPAHDWGNFKTDHYFKQHAYHFLGQIMKHADETQGGTGPTRQVTIGESAGITWCNPDEARQRSSVNAAVQLSMPWATGYSSYVVSTTDIRRNWGQAKLKDLRQQRRAECVLKVAEDLDAAWWGVPDVTNNKKPAGFFYYFPPITAAQVTAGTGAGAHQGANSPSFSATAGVDKSAAAYSRTQSYNGAFTNNAGEITEEDLRRIARLFTHLHYVVPDMAAGDVAAAQYGNWGVFSTEAVRDGYAKAMRYRMDNVAKDRDPTYGYGGGLDQNSDSPLVMGRPILWAEPLDNAAGNTTDLTNRGYNPFCVINYAYCVPNFEKGMKLKEEVAPRSYDRPTLHATDLEISYQLLVADMQKGGGVLSYPYA